MHHIEYSIFDCEQIGVIWLNMSSELKPTVKHIVVYRQPRSRKCPNCEILENLLKINNIEFDSVNLVTPESMTEMATHWIFPMFTPVLQIDGKIYYKELWSIHGKILNIPEIKKLIDKTKKDWKDIEDNEVICEGGVCTI